MVPRMRFVAAMTLLMAVSAGCSDAKSHAKSVGCHVLSCPTASTSPPVKSFTCQTDGFARACLTVRVDRSFLLVVSGLRPNSSVDETAVSAGQSVVAPLVTADGTGDFPGVQTNPFAVPGRRSVTLMFHGTDRHQKPIQFTFEIP